MSMMKAARIFAMGASLALAGAPAAEAVAVYEAQEYIDEGSFGSIFAGACASARPWLRVTMPMSERDSTASTQKPPVPRNADRDDCF